MGIPLNLDFEMGVAKPIDSRFVMTKAQMLSVDDNVMPPVYGCWCSDDGKYYIYNKNNIATLELGKFVVQPDDAFIQTMQSQVDAQRSYIEAITDLQSRVLGLEQTIANDKKNYIITEPQSFISGVWRKDFLPDHEKSEFCREVNVTYKGEYSATDADNVVVNGQTISLDNTHIVETEETTNVKVVFENGSINVYCGGSIVGNVTDTIILTVEINAPNISNESISDIDCTYQYVDYGDVDVKSKNGNPITEKFSGEIEYWDVMCTVGYGVRTSVPNNIAAHFARVVYSIGDYTGVGEGIFDPCAEDLSTYETLDECIIRHIYMAHWDLSKITNLRNMFLGTARNTNQGNWNNYYIRKHLYDRLDFTNVKFSPNNFCNDGTPSMIRCFRGERVGSLAGYNTVLRGGQYQNSIYFGINPLVRTYGDLSTFDTTNVNYIVDLFALNIALEFAGDVGNWQISNACTRFKCIFRSCFNLRGISDSIANWDVSNGDRFDEAFESTMWMGDDTLHNLWKWNVGNSINFHSMFGYVVPKNVQTDKHDYSKVGEVAVNANRLRIGDYADDAERRALEERNVELIKSMVVKPKSNLSFVERWNVSKGEQFEFMFANNPYLINLGDLREWEITDSATLQTNGFEGFIQYCTALETLYMPSIPRGVNVIDFARGCTSLANIELDELNVEAISFGDSPLTKQSVLNLVNAATDDVTITLRDDIYNLYYNDTDVVSAINTKAGSGINVVLGM